MLAGPALRPALSGPVRTFAAGRRPMKKMAVIGAGITGVTTARALMERGFDVTVFDRHRYAAMETSFANGGQLSASNAEVWNSYGTILKGIKWMFQKDAPLLMNPLADISWHKYSWMAEFMAQIPNYRSNTIDTVKLAIAARELLLKHAKTYDFDFNPEHRGILHFYSDKKELVHRGSDSRPTGSSSWSCSLGRSLTPVGLELDPRRAGV